MNVSCGFANVPPGAETLATFPSGDDQPPKVARTADQTSSLDSQAKITQTHTGAETFVAFENPIWLAHAK